VGYKSARGGKGNYFRDARVYERGKGKRKAKRVKGWRLMVGVVGDIGNGTYLSDQIVACTREVRVVVVSTRFGGRDGLQGEVKALVQESKVKWVEPENNANEKFSLTTRNGEITLLPVKASLEVQNSQCEDR
jgi:hypothetical protein